MSKVWIGTSGWTYDGWRGPFYPPERAKKNWLCWYGSQFPTTEINGSFYRTPSLEAVAAWRDQTPKDFLFAWKASKFITRWKRLSENCANSIDLMETRLKALSPKDGVVLFQLPRQFSKNRERFIPVAFRAEAQVLVRYQSCGCQASTGALGCSSRRPWSITCNSARNTAGTPAPVAAEMTSGAFLAARLSRAVCCFSCCGASASALLSATISGFAPSPSP
jgi:hypothetical protein